MTKTTKSTPKAAGSEASYIKPTIKKLEKSQVEITGSISAEQFDSYKKKALQNINNEITIDGFRKGKVPESVLISKVGEMSILDEMAQLALTDVYPKIVINESIDALGRPEVQITKIAAGNPLEFKIVTAVVPEIKLGDYKKIAKEVYADKTEVEPVTEKEIDDAILHIRRSRADHSGHAHENLSPEEHEKIVDAALPEFTDAFVQGLGKFADIADFKEKMKAGLFEDKKQRAHEKKRIALSDKLVETSTIDVPPVLIESELKRIEAQFNDDVTRMGVTLEDYLKHANKSIEDIRKEWQPFAEKKAKTQLILNRIADLEKIQADALEIENEVNHIIEHYKDADREHAATYAETILTNEKVFAFLETQA